MGCTRLASVAASLAVLLACTTGRDVAAPGEGSPPSPQLGPPPVEPAREFAAPEARQAVAVDDRHFYVIGNHEIGKYDKRTGERVASWQGPADGPITHLNSGVVVDGRLYCAHSNYPHIPMTSSIEVFDTGDLSHVATRSLGIVGSSLTWIDRHDESWWLGFGMYTGEKAEPGKDPRWTTVTQYDDDWRRLQAWVFPPEIVEKLRPKTNSGASWGPDGLLYCTGHDDFEVHAMRLPAAGSTLEWVRTLPVAHFGQGIAFDRTADDGWSLWGIVKKPRLVRVTTLSPP